MIYNWDIKELKKRRRHLLKLLVNPKYNEKDKKEIMEDFELLNEAINEIEVDKLFTLFSKEESYMDKEQLIPKSYYRSFSKISKNLLRLIYSSTNYFDLLNLDDCSKDQPNYYFSFDCIVESAASFYRSLPNNKYYLEISKYLNNKNHLLTFKYSNEYDLLYGTTFQLFYQNPTSYILVYIMNNINDLLTLDHELAHAYFNKYSTSKTLHTPYYYLTEVEGMFFEYLKEEYLLSQHLYQSDISYIRQEQMDIVSNMIRNLYISDLVIKYYDKTGKIDEEKIMELILKKGLLKEYDIDILCNSLLMYPRYSIKDCISYFTFLDLKNIAEKDVEKALYLLEEIRKDHNPNIFSTLRKNEITFMDDNFKNLKKEFKSLQ